MNEYADKLGVDYTLQENEIKQLKKYLSQLLDKKKLQKIKDVIYESEEGNIKDIPNLQFNKTTKKFLLKKDQKKVSTLKSLGPKKKR